VEDENTSDLCRPQLTLSDHRADKTQPHSGLRKAIKAALGFEPFGAKMGTGILSKSDPTDHALATIASIFDKPEGRRAAKAEQKSAAAAVEADGYYKIGPGPMAAIRFKWTVRRAENGDYFVDETIGEGSAAITSGPMQKDAAVKLVDDREREARTRFDQLRAEMSGRAAATEIFHRGGEA
jgi:hypothetical protein